MIILRLWFFSLTWTRSRPPPQSLTFVKLFGSDEEPKERGSCACVCPCVLACVRDILQNNSENEF